MDLPLTSWLRRGRFHSELTIRARAFLSTGFTFGGTHRRRCFSRNRLQGTGLAYPVMRANTVSAQTNWHKSNQKRKPV